ncbi:penicillin-binding protein activator [Pelagibacteraceae bacterium]|nr:penicillin-binding protein activator [Pelagibacteraceae bacterium]
MIKIVILLSYIILFFNSNLFSNEKESSLKIGLLAPFTGEYKDLGNSLLLSTQLALKEIGDKKITIIPRDSGTNNKLILNRSIQEISELGAKVIIGPVDSSNFNEIKKYQDVIFISLSNMHPEISENIISIGISLDSQLESITNFIKSKNKNKTLIIYPKNKYSEYVKERLKILNIKSYKTFQYNPDPKILTSEIEKLTNYDQRKNNLKIRKKILEKQEDEKSKNELKKLEQIYTLGKVNFDSIIIIDFGNSLKSVLASLVFSDVNDSEILFTTVNQWFDESIFYENSVKNLYYPSINLKNFKQHNDKYIKAFGLNPNELTILGYDAVGLIYYVWKKNNKINKTSDFFIKEKIKGKIGNFNFANKKVSQELEIYQTGKREFIKY